MNGSKLRDENSPAKEESSFKSLPNDKILDSTKLKAFADDRMNFTQFLAHLRITCSRGAFRITWYPSCVVRRLSCVVNNFLNIFSSQTTGPIWTKLGRNVPWMTLFKKLFAKFWSVHKHGSGERGLFALYGHEEILKIYSSPKPLVIFWNNFTEMFLDWPFSEIFRPNLISH